jgi:PHD/YefM family antitoxin component YafN of YafNO toxin-antitoxin module
MIELHPEILEKDGKKQFVILPYEEFAAIQEALADADDLAALRAAKRDEGDAPTIPLDQVVDELELSGQA